MRVQQNAPNRSGEATKGNRTAVASTRDTGNSVYDSESGAQSTGRPRTSAVDRDPPWLPTASAANALLEARERARARESVSINDAPIDSLQFLRPADVCRLLRISKPTLWRLRQINGFPEPMDLTDRAIGSRRSEVEAWLAKRYGGTRASKGAPRVLRSESTDASDE